MTYSIDFGSGHDQTAQPPDHLHSPSISVSYRSTRFEGDLVMSPYAWLNNWSDPRDLIGFRGKVDLRYFWGIRPGIRLAVEYANMTDLAQSSDYKMQMLIGSAGLVLRM